MRKRMSRMKKEMAVAVAAAMCISLVGCGGGSSKKEVADKKEAVETNEEEIINNSSEQQWQKQRKRKQQQRNLLVLMTQKWPISWQELPGREFPAPRRSWWRPLMRKMPIWQF